MLCVVRQRTEGSAPDTIFAQYHNREQCYAEVVSYAPSTQEQDCTPYSNSVTAPQ
jgi:hypothetical protein